MVAVVVAVVMLWSQLSALIAAAVAAVVTVAASVTILPSVLRKARAAAEYARNAVSRRTAELDEAIRNDEIELQQLDAARRLADYMTELRSPERYEKYRGLIDAFTRISNVLATP